MKPEEKQLLLHDLCARLPYGVKIRLGDYDYQVCGYNSEKEMPLKIWYYYDSNLNLKSYIDVYLTDYRPYLRPMSTMTEEEKQEMKLTLSPKGTAIFDNDGIHIPMTHTGDFVPYDFMQKVLSFLYERHFDVNGLIPLGDAIEVTEENNPYKN